MWKDDNRSEILEYPFDFNRYVEEKLREIDDLEERHFAKTVLLEGLAKVITCTEEKYRELEQRVYEEIQIPDNCYETVMTIVKKCHYDPTNGTLYPVIPEDVEEAAERTEANVGTVFVELNQQDLLRFEKIKSFFGKILLNGEEQPVTFHVKPAVRYRHMMEGVYQIFQDNHIPWSTVNSGYLDHFYDVFIEAEGIRKEFGDFEHAKIQWGEFEPSVKYEMIPLWNIQWVTYDSADFMLPCINGIYYEHEFSLPKENRQDGYLIKTNEEILEIRHEKGKIAIKSETETFEGWEALRLIQEKPVRSLDYNAPILTNHKADTFFRRYSENSRVQLMTKTDLFRRIMEMDISDYIEAVGYEICENPRDYPLTEGMNWFVRDELFPIGSRKVLLLQFQAKDPGNYLNDSMVRFVISQLQMEISEYRCVGVIV